MRTEVTDNGVLVPISFLRGVKEAEIRKEHNIIVIVPLSEEDPILGLADDPADDVITDALVNHDK